MSKKPLLFFLIGALTYFSLLVYSPTSDQYLAAAEQSSEGKEKAITPEEVTELILPSLIEKAGRIGKVSILINFVIDFRPEGYLSESDKQSQRKGIQNYAERVLADLQGLSFQVDAQYRFIPAIALTVDSRALKQIASLPYVRSIEENSSGSPFLSNSNEKIGSPLAWDHDYDGSYQYIAIVDTGVDKTHPWFSSGEQNKVYSEACFSSNIFPTYSSLCPGGVTESTAENSGLNCLLPGCDHGTHIAGIAAGNSGLSSGSKFGVARGADIIAIQVFTKSTDPELCGDIVPCLRLLHGDVIKALERVYELSKTLDIAAVNLSLGSNDKYEDSSSCEAQNPTYKQAIENLRSVDIAVVAASGNNGWVDGIIAPACISAATSVSNTTDADEVEIDANIYPEIDLLAPGTDIESSVPGSGFDTGTGTSVSAPHVAGALAVLRQAKPLASVDALIDLLQQTGTKVYDIRPGHIEEPIPRINLDLALGQLLENPILLAETKRVFFDSYKPGTVWAATSRGLYLSIDDGRSWELKLYGQIWAADIQPVEPPYESILYATQYVPGQGDRFLKSTDGGDNWYEASEGLRGGAESIVVNQCNPLEVFKAGYGSTRIYKTSSAGEIPDDGEDDWFPSDSGIAGSEETVFALTSDPPPDCSNMYAIGINNPNISSTVYRSTNGGDSWVPRLSSTIYESITVDPIESSNVYVGTERQGIQRSADGGQTWSEPIIFGLPCGFFSCNAISAMEVHPNNSAVVYAGSRATRYTGTGLYVSHDWGETWREVHRDPDVYRTWSVAVSPHPPHRLFVGRLDGLHVFDGPQIVIEKIGNGSGTVTDDPFSPLINCGPTCSAFYAPFEPINLDASADPGSEFMGFSGDPGCLFGIPVMDGDKKCFATFSRPILKVTVYGSGEGTIVSDPPGIACPGDCEEAFDIGTQVTLSATPADGTIFSYWTGEQGCQDGIIEMEMDSDTAISCAAFFSRRSLTIYKSGSGDISITSVPSGIDCGEDCQGYFDDGTDVQLVVTPDADTEFEGWLGPVCEDSLIHMDADKECTASFTSFKMLSIRVDGEGGGIVSSLPAGISCGNSGGDCSEEYNKSRTIWLTAVPDVDSVFIGWSGDEDCEDGVLWMLEDRSCTARFEPGQGYSLNIQRAGPGSGVIESSPTALWCGHNCTAKFVTGSSVTLLPTPFEGSVFERWDGDADCLDGVLDMDTDKHCVAHFSLQEFSLNVEFAGNGYGQIWSDSWEINCVDNTGNCTHPFSVGTEVALNVGTNPNSEFIGWGGDPDCSDGIITIDSDNTCIATINLLCMVLYSPPSTCPDAYIEDKLVSICGGVSNTDACGGPIERIVWDWGDGEINASWFPASHTYDDYGLYTITVYALDDQDNIGSSESVDILVELEEVIFSDGFE